MYGSIALQAAHNAFLLHSCEGWNPTKSKKNYIEVKVPFSK